jgi:hypothetical protein
VSAPSAGDTYPMTAQALLERESRRGQ